MTTTCTCAKTNPCVKNMYVNNTCALYLLKHLSLLFFSCLVHRRVLGLHSAMSSHPRIQEALKGLCATGSFVVLDNFIEPGSSGRQPLEGMIEEMNSLMGNQSPSPTTPRQHDNTTNATTAPASIGKFHAGELAGDSGFWQTKYDPSKRSDFITWLSEGEMEQQAKSSNNTTASNGGGMPHLLAYLQTCRSLAQGIRDSCSRQHNNDNKKHHFGVDDNDDDEVSTPPMVKLMNNNTEGDATPPSLTCDRMMLALYPLSEPSRFSQHVDNPNGNGRILTFTFYLNEEWEAARDGGQLRIHHQDEGQTVTDIEPIYNRLVIFLSDNRTPHEVLPTKPTPEGIALHPFRRSITLWFSYLSPQQEKDAYAGAFKNWIERIKQKKQQQQQAATA